MNKSNLNASLFLTVSCFFHFPVIIESAQAIAMPGLHVHCTPQPANWPLSVRVHAELRAPPCTKVRAFPRPHILRKVVQVHVLHHCKSKNFSRTSATRYPPPDTFYVMGGKLAHINDFSNLGHGGHPIWGQAG